MSTSLQHTCRKAEQIVDAYKAAVSASNFREVCRLLPTAIEVAGHCCAAGGFSIEELLAAQPEHKGSPRSLVRLPRKYTKLFVKTCADIQTPSTRYATKYFLRYGILLTRIVLTVKAYSGLMAIAFLPEEAPALQRVAKAIAPPAAKTGSGDDQPPTTKVPQSSQELSAAAYGTVDLPLDWADRLQEGREQRDARLTAAFLDMIEELPPWEPLGPAGFSIPGWDRAPSLPWLRDFFDAILGPVRRNPAADEKIVAAHPFFLTADEEIATLWPDVINRLDTASSPTWPLLTDERRPSVFFPGALWRDTAAPTQGPLPDRSGAAASVLRRRKIFPPDTGVAQTLSHGFLRQIQLQVAIAGSALILGAAGTGKSSTLALLDFGDRTVFEVGDGLDTSFRGRNSYKLADFDRLLLKAARTKGRRTLIVHELALSPPHLAGLGVFDQILIVGDPRQPTPAGHVDHILDFMRRIGACTVVLPVVYRSKNSNAFRFNNYIAYGGAFTAFRPWKLVSTGDSAERRDNSINVFTCSDTPAVVAATMLAHAVAKCRHGRSVLIGTDDPDVIAALAGLLQLLPEMPVGLECRHLDDLQGRYADVVLIDVLEVAAHVPAVDVALRWWVMVFGRARYTLSLVVRKREMSKEQGAGPASVAISCLHSDGAALEGRSRAARGAALGPLASSIAKVSDSVFVDELDEQTVAVCQWTITLFVCVRDVLGSNVKYLQEEAAVVEIPELFEDGRDRASVIAKITNLLSGGTFLTPPGITTLDKLIERYTEARRHG